MSNPLLDQSRAFAVRIINMYKYLSAEKREFVVSKQILRSGTSVGANIAEAQGAQTKADFIYKIHISLKEANETSYWLESLFDSKFLTKNQYESMNADLNSLIYMMIRILKTAKENESKKGR